jgi:broad specificity phosphatase PhoE
MKIPKKISKVEKSLVLIRHSHRNTRDQELDNGLTAKGRRQAEITAKTLTRIFAGTEPKFISSPKIRCLETLEPVAKRFSSQVRPDPLLLEQQENESFSLFKKRIRRFLDRWIQGPEQVTLVCSHGDWLPIAVKMLVDAPAEFKKGGWAEIRWMDGDAWFNFPN